MCILTTQLGINNTFCMPEGEEPVTGSSESASLSAGKSRRGPFFASPIVQAHHFQLAPDFIEVASATGKKNPFHLIYIM